MLADLVHKTRMVRRLEEEQPLASALLRGLIDGQGVHHVPKRMFEQLLIETPEGL